MAVDKYLIAGVFIHVSLTCCMLVPSLRRLDADGGN